MQTLKDDVVYRLNPNCSHARIEISGEIEPFQRKLSEFGVIFRKFSTSHHVVSSDLENLEEPVILRG